MAKSHKVSAETRASVITRSSGRCERCAESLGGVFGYSVHHRTPRGMGGSVKKEINESANLIVLCGSGTTGCHGWVESNRTEARKQGYLLYRIDEPDQVPFVSLDGVTRFIDNTGYKSP